MRIADRGRERAINPDHPKTKKEKELADNARLLRAWKKFHREELEEALAGIHRDVMGRLMTHLAALRSARDLVTFIEAQDWGAVDAHSRLVARTKLTTRSASCASAWASRRWMTRCQVSHCARIR